MELLDPVDSIGLERVGHLGLAIRVFIITVNLCLISWNNGFLDNMSNQNPNLTIPRFTECIRLSLVTKLYISSTCYTILSIVYMFGESFVTVLEHHT